VFLIFQLFVCLNNGEFGRTKVLALYEQSKQAFSNNTLEKQVLKDSIKLCYDTVATQIRKQFDSIVDAITLKVKHSQSSLLIIIDRNASYVTHISCFSFCDTPTHCY
jgi:hypothetical protein